MISAATRVRCRASAAAFVAVGLLGASAVAGGGDEACVRLLEQAATQAARDRIDAPDRFEVLSVRAGTVAASRVGCDVEVAGVEGPSASGIVAVTATRVSTSGPRSASGKVGCATPSLTGAFNRANNSVSRASLAAAITSSISSISNSILGR